jgi:3-oxoacyl-[acyl-carrier protein] reductase
MPPLVEPPLADQVALVTGSSRGLGATIARRLAADGATVVVNYRNSQELADAVVADIIGAGGRALALGADTTDEDAVAGLLARVVAEFGPVRLLVNNSGIMTRSPIESMPVALWDEMMTSHLRSAFLVTRECLRTGTSALEPLPGRRIAAKVVNLGSGVVAAGGRSKLGAVHYVTAKAGLEGFTQALAAEVAPRMTANVVAPGIHFTDMMGTVDDETRELLSAIFLLGLPRDEDVAATVAYLLSPDADHVTAQTITPNGGAA